MKKCRPVVKGPSGGTLLFRFALPARSASDGVRVLAHDHVLCLGAACAECIEHIHARISVLILYLGAACTGCIAGVYAGTIRALLCLGAACTECIEAGMPSVIMCRCFASALPARGASAKADKLRHTIL